MYDASPLLQQAELAGFDIAGICDAVPPPHHQAYSAWIANEMHGSMAYLQDHLPLKAHPANLLPGAKSILAVALNYNQDVPVQKGRMRVARYAQGRDYHKVVRQRLRKVEAWLQETHPNMETRICVDSAPLMERDFAQMAGIGWFGKNTMLINSKRGSWFVLGFLLITERFAPSSPAVGGCGTCRACIEACPTGAIIFADDRWQVDARSCVSYLTIEHKGEIPVELESGIEEWTFGCDICQEVCPFNAPRESQPQRAISTRIPDFQKRRDWPLLEQVDGMTHEEWDALTAGSPVRRAGFDGLKRNARINLRNLNSG